MFNKVNIVFWTRVCGMFQLGHTGWFHHLASSSSCQSETVHGELRHACSRGQGAWQGECKPKAKIVIEKGCRHQKNNIQNLPAWTDVVFYRQVTLRPTVNSSRSPEWHRMRTAKGCPDDLYIKITVRVDKPQNMKHGG